MKADTKRTTSPAPLTTILAKQGRVVVRALNSKDKAKSDADKARASLFETLNAVFDGIYEEKKRRPTKNDLLARVIAAWHFVEMTKDMVKEATKDRAFHPAHQKHYELYQRRAAVLLEELAHNLEGDTAGRDAVTCVLLETTEVGPGDDPNPEIDAFYKKS